ncbi:hypothetical protein Golob_000659, partial [Gossypium lobatum]|nr:hypothetical protein [Gossypium lobatum]
MPRSRNKEDATPSDDYGWRWGEPVEGNRNNVKRNNTVERAFGYKKKRNVVPCPHVLAEVRKTIAQQLQEYHSEKVANGDDDDEELTITRRESMRSQVEMEERQ